jgi:hypothetical protein
MPALARSKPQRTDESAIVVAIRLRLGEEPDLVLWRQSVAGVEVFDPKTGRSRWQHAGLPKGSSDLIGVLAPLGRFVALEAKTPRGRLTPDQKAWLALVRRFGGFATSVRSVEDALAALERARRGETE